MFVSGDQWAREPVVPGRPVNVIDRATRRFAKRRAARGERFPNQPYPGLPLDWTATVRELIQSTARAAKLLVENKNKTNQLSQELLSRLTLLAPRPTQHVRIRRRNCEVRVPTAETGADRIVGLA